jgi:hypothetical protein
MPRAPSTIEAAKPATPTTSRSFTGATPAVRDQPEGRMRGVRRQVSRGVLNC